MDRQHDNLKPQQSATVDIGSVQPAAGGLKKVMYTLKTAQAAGLRPTAKALRANNTCKACGLGMGGQRGGMTDEAGTFPSVCNKSVQAQSSDLQPAIPHAVFQHTIAELQELSDREFNSLGRLNTPLYKTATDDHYRPIDWDQALAIAAERLAVTNPQRTFFYSSGRSSNEAGFILQLFARLYGTNNVNNCSYYCHQATTEGLARSIGTGTATVELADLAECDFIFLLGANPASNHPRFIYQLGDCRGRGGEVVVINPAREPGLVRFAMPKSARSLLTGGSPIASEYLQPKIGGDIALLQGIAKAVLELNAQDADFVAQRTNGYDAYERQLNSVTWEAIVAHSGVDIDSIRRVAAKYAQAKRAVFAWGMGLTHHTHGVRNVEEVANLAMLRGMVGKRFAGLLPLRGHSNVQGIGSIGVKPVLAKDVLQKIESTLGVDLPRESGMDTLSALQAAQRGEIDAALLLGGNLYGATPGADFARRSFDSIGFKVYLTTTLNRGHAFGVEGSEALVLPVAARDEEPQATTQESMFNFVRYSSGGIERQDNVRAESDILCDLATRVLGSGSFDFRAFADHGNVRKTIAACVPGMQELATIDVARQEFHVANRLLHEPKFHTKDGRGQFQAGPIPEALVGADGFVLASVRSEGQFNTTVYEEEDVYRGATHRWTLLMSPVDMRRLELQRGDSLDVTSKHGTMAAVEAIPFDLPAGSVLAYFPEANVLVGQDVDSRSRTPAFKSVVVSLVPINPTTPRDALPPRPVAIRR